MPIINLRHVEKEYVTQAGCVRAVDGIDLQVNAGEFLAITGRSGAGKSTLINLIAGLDRVTSGEVWVAGSAVHRMHLDDAAAWRGRTIGVVFQSFELLPSLTVLQNVMLPMDFAHRYPPRQQQERALHLLEQMDIAEHAHKLPSEVSGGQQQRVGIARALANDPPIVIADEPTGSLDSATASSVFRLFEALVSEGKTLLLVTHDLDLANRASRAITMADGAIVADVRREVARA